MAHYHYLIDHSRNLRRERQIGRYYVSDIALISVMRDLMDARQKQRSEIARAEIGREIDRVETMLTSRRPVRTAI
ncbi:MAG: hypothetical protein AB7H90_01260 [Alphaproteobacteria bacterium]